MVVMRTEAGRGKLSGIRDAILVTSIVTPAFVPYLDRMKAVVTDEEGITCCVAVIAMEFRIYTTVGTGRATASCKDGDRIEFVAYGGTGVVKRV